MYNHNAYTPSAYQAKNILLDVIELGNDILRGGVVSDHIFDRWLDLSYKALKATFGNESYNIEADYMKIQIEMLRHSLDPSRKLDYCLDYLVSLAKAI